MFNNSLKVLCRLSSIPSKLWRIVGSISTPLSNIFLYPFLSVETKAFSAEPTALPKCFFPPLSILKIMFLNATACMPIEVRLEPMSPAYRPVITLLNPLRNILTVAGSIEVSEPLPTCSITLLTILS